MPLFTVETAAEMGRRSAELRKQRENQRALILATAPSQAELTTDYSKAKADRTRAQIELIDQMIDQADDAEVLDQLTRSKERLFKIWARLAQIPTDPKPVQQRATNTRKELPPPTVAQAQPSAAQASAEPQKVQAGQG